MSFEKKPKEEIGLKSLISFIKKLYNRYGTREYTYLARADMRILGND